MALGVEGTAELDYLNEKMHVKHATILLTIINGSVTESRLVLLTA